MVRRSYFHVSGAFNDDIRYQMYIAMPDIREEQSIFIRFVREVEFVFYLEFLRYPFPY
jgi:hypothetical protein